MGIAGPLHDERSWRFHLDPDNRDPVLGIEYLGEACRRADPDFSEGITVAAMVDLRTGRQRYQVEDLSEPEDLRTALNELPQARMQWDGFPRSTKRTILEWISTAKTDTTRTRRVEQTAHEAAAGRRANQWRQV